MPVAQDVSPNFEIAEVVTGGTRNFTVKSPEWVAAGESHAKSASGYATIAQWVTLKLIGGYQTPSFAVGVASPLVVYEPVEVVSAAAVEREP
jgi:hypothetical protein